MNMAILEPHIPQADNQNPGSRIIEQVVWLMFWPMLTVMLVVGAVYFDRMHVLKKMAGNQGVLLVEYGENALLQGVYVIDSDMKYLERNKAVQALLAGAEDEVYEPVEKLFEKLNKGNRDYIQIFLLDAGGDVLIASSDDNLFHPEGAERVRVPAEINTFDPGKIHVSGGACSYITSTGKRVAHDGLQFIKPVSTGTKKPIGFYWHQLFSGQFV